MLPQGEHADHDGKGCLNILHLTLRCSTNSFILDHDCSSFFILLPFADCFNVGKDIKKNLSRPEMCCMAKLIQALGNLYTSRKRAERQGFLEIQMVSEAYVFSCSSRISLYFSEANAPHCPPYRTAYWRVFV